MILNRFVSFLPLLITVSSFATVIQMEEFYHPDLNQTLIFMHDMHFHVPTIDNRQTEVAAEAIGALQASLITELIPNDQMVNAPFAICLLADRCLKKGAPVVCADYRKAFGVYLDYSIGMMAASNSCDDLRSRLLHEDAEATIGKLFWFAFDEIREQYFNVIKPLEQDLTMNKAYDNQFNALSKELVTTCRTIHEWVENGRENWCIDWHELSGRIVSDLFIKADDGGFLLNTKSMNHKLFQASNTLFDMTLLKELHQKRADRVVFMHAGATHLRRLAKECLPHIGYEVKHSISHQDQAYKSLQDNVEKCVRKETLSHIFEIEPSKAECLAVVDIEMFLKECKTLAQDR
jgi:hypothetical protein